MADSLVNKIATVLMFISFSSLTGEENFILINGTTNELIKEFGPDINERVTPACSFNIVLSLMGYDSEILKDEKSPIWDFQEGYDDFSESWKVSQTPESWMSRSCVWYSKIIGLQLGLETIQNYLALLEYGNRDMSGGLAEPGMMNPAWISSSLKVSPKEQVDFIQKMVSKKIALPSHVIEMTRTLLLKGELPGGWKLYGKSGLGSISGQDDNSLKVRWFVGWIENNRSFFPFAYQMREKEIDVTQTIPRVKQLLQDSNIMNLKEDYKNMISVRDYTPEDTQELANIYFNTVHRINIKDYTQEQVDAWAPPSGFKSNSGTEDWAKKFARTKPIIAVIGDTIVGFAEFEPNGHIDCFYCHHEWVGKGVGSSLMNEILVRAKKSHINRIFAEVSITAKHFFEKYNFIVVTEQVDYKKGIGLVNYKMERML